MVSYIPYGFFILVSEFWVQLYVVLLFSLFEILVLVWFWWWYFAGADVCFCGVILEQKPKLKQEIWRIKHRNQHYSQKHV
jgi:hypothetical protein